MNLIKSKADNREITERMNEILEADDNDLFMPDQSIRMSLLSQPLD